MHGAPMHYSIVPDGNIIPDSRSAFLKSTMYAGTILYIYFITYLNEIDISSYNSVEPEAAIIAGYYITNDGGIRRNKTIAAKLRMFVFNRKY